MVDEAICRPLQHPQHVHETVVTAVVGIRNLEVAVRFGQVGERRIE